MDDLIRYANNAGWDNEASKNKYIYPIDIDLETARTEGARLAIGNPPEETYVRGPYVCATSPQSHLGPFKHAIDFLVPDDTPVVASCAGVVIEIQEHSNTWADGFEYRDFLNYMTIQHANGEFTQYCHLAQHSVTKHNIRVGSVVARGQKIAIVGKTGWTDRDHLHFIVFRVGVKIGPFTFKSLVPCFQ